MTWKIELFRAFLFFIDIEKCDGCYRIVKFKLFINFLSNMKIWKKNCFCTVGLIDHNTVGVNENLIYLILPFIILHG